MTVFLKLSLVALIPVTVSVLLYLLEKKTAIKKLKGIYRQIIYGIIFGLTAIFATEFGGVDIGGASANVRDASVLISGLVFGPISGIISGLLGGIERYFATFWGQGEFTQLACSISTILAGFIGAALRKYMFDDKKPSTLYAFGIGLVTEVLHMLMIFFTNMTDITKAFTVAKGAAPSMILVNSFSVMLAVLIIRIIGKEYDLTKKAQMSIATIFQRWLLVVVAFAMFVTSGFTYLLQRNVSAKETESVLSLNIADVRQDILDSSDKNILEKVHAVAEEIDVYTGVKNKAYLEGLAQKHNVLGVHIIGADGIITASTREDYIGFDMTTSEQSNEFMALLNGNTKELVQEYQPTSFDETISRKFAGAVLADGGFVQIGYDAEHFQHEVGEEIKSATLNRHIGKSGCIIVADKNLSIISDRHDNEGKNLAVTGISIDTATMKENTYYAQRVYGTDSYIMYTLKEGFYIVGVLPVAEAIFSRDLSVYITVFIEILVFVSLFIVIYFLIKKLVVNNIKKVNDSLAEITGGNLDITLNVRSNEEFASLSDDINSTVDTLKSYIAAAAARIDKELEFAKAIQYSSLPSVFPAYPNRKEFDLYAGMYTAKEVGGDFYDFYLLNENELIFSVSDVSGKGIPAAMFMMRAKALIKNHIESGLDLSEAFIHANDNLCENNAAEMFVTSWLGKLNLKTGLLTFVNAGHNPPLIRRDGKYEYLKGRAGFVLAGMEGVKYRTQEIQLAPGDAVFLYTDGVTEAHDTESLLYGEDRLIKVVNESAEMSAVDICTAVKRDVDAFVDEAEQFDDITMLCMRYHGEAAPKKEGNI